MSELFNGKEYRFAVALLNFSKAWDELAAASKAVPDMDVSTLYPLYMLDYEEIQPAVKQWCNYTASKIMQNVPDRIPNPACANCPHIFDGLGADGFCLGQRIMHCANYPIAAFERALVTPFCVAHGIVTKDLSDEALQLVYTTEVQKIHEQNSKESSPDSAV